jgi:hypothetical protein
MHPILVEIENELKNADKELTYRFALGCIEEVADNLEEESAIKAYAQFKQTVKKFNNTSMVELDQLARDLRAVAQSHPGSRSIDGTRHAAVSATYALSKAAEGNAVQAAAYAAYSSIYGYGGYAVNDPNAFIEVHQRQLHQLRQLKAHGEHDVSP